MKTKAISSIFVLFAIAAGMASMAPAAFADHAEVSIITVDESGFSQACVDEGCYIPSVATVDVGGVVTMTNTDPQEFTHLHQELLTDLHQIQTVSLIQVY